MIFGKQRRRAGLPGGYFHLQEEHTKTRMSGYGHGDHIKLVDEYGNIWTGSAVRNPDGSVVYRFRSSDGRNLSGVCEGLVVTLRDEKGRTWKGFID